MDSSRSLNQALDDEDEETLSNSIIKISKKELNDLVTELFNIIPESTTEEELMADNLANSVLTEHSQAEVPNRWEGKQEPVSEDENGRKKKFSDRITFEKKNYTRLSQGKSETQDREVARVKEIAIRPKRDGGKEKKKPEEKRISPRKPATVVSVTLQQEEAAGSIDSAPPSLQENLKAATCTTEYVQIHVTQAARFIVENPTSPTHITPPPATSPILLPSPTSPQPPTSPPDTQRPTARQRQRPNSVSNQFLVSDAQTRNVLIDIGNSLRNRNSLADREQRTHRIERIQRKRMEKHIHMGPKYK